MRVVRPLICLVAILGLIWCGSDALVDIFWCVGCQRTLTATRALIALTFLAGLVAGLLSAAWAQVRIARDARGAGTLPSQAGNPFLRHQLFDARVRVDKTKLTLRHRKRDGE